MSKTVSESIFSGQTVIIPMSDVQHIERHATNSVPGIKVITKHTRWDTDTGDWANAIWISEPEAVAFRRAWCAYRAELETDTLADLEPNELVRENGQFGAGA
jgi:hypothetical protein